MNIPIMFAALNGQLLSETTPMALEAAEVVVARELGKHVTDKELLRKAGMMLFNLKGAQTLDGKNVDLLIKSIIKKHYIDPSSSTLALPETIHKVGISDSDAQRIFYLEHADYQEDGWSCGLRALFNAAAFEKELRFCPQTLSSNAIGNTSLALRDTNPAIAGAIEYVSLRSQLDEVCSLLRKDEDRVDEAAWLLKQDNPDMLKVFLQLQPDYFIRRLALRFLDPDSFTGGANSVIVTHRPNVIDAIALLGKSSHKSIILVCDNLVMLIMEELAKPGVAVQLDAIITDLYAAIPDQKGQIQRELELFISWGKDVAGNRDKIVRFILTNMYPGMSSMARHVRALCRSVPLVRVCFERVKKELAQLEKLLDSKSIYDCRTQLDETAYKKFTLVQDQICKIDRRMDAICRAIDSCTCPKITVSLALFHSGADFDNDDIVDFLKSSQKDGINAALAHINEDEHTKIQTCIAKLTRLLALLDRVGDELNEIRDDLNNELEMAQSIVKEMQADVTRLRRRLSDPTLGEPNLVSNLDTALREARDLLQKADSQRIVEAFRMLQPEYPEQGSSSQDSIDLVSDRLAQLKDPSVIATLDILDRAKTYEEALRVVGAIEQITSIDTHDVVTLLKSDQRKEESSTRSDSAAVRARIGAIKRSRLKKGELAAPDHLFKLARMPDLGLPIENVHILGDFVGQGLLFDIGDGVLLGIPSQERAHIERSETKVEQSERVVRAIRDHFKTHYLDKDETGAHYFICNLKRPSEHWIKVALVKIKGKKPLLTLLDSKNYPIHPDPKSLRVGTDTVLAFLYDKFLRPLNPSQK